MFNAPLGPRTINQDIRILLFYCNRASDGPYLLQLPLANLSVLPPFEMVNIGGWICVVYDVSKRRMNR